MSKDRPFDPVVNNDDAFVAMCIAGANIQFYGEEFGGPKIVVSKNDVEKEMKIDKERYLRMDSKYICACARQLLADVIVESVARALGQGMPKH